jgi:hypothetical protein
MEKAAGEERQPEKAQTIPHPGTVQGNPPEAVPQTFRTRVEELETEESQQPPPRMNLRVMHLQKAHCDHPATVGAGEGSPKRCRKPLRMLAKRHAPKMEVFMAAEGVRRANSAPSSACKII